VLQSGEAAWRVTDAQVASVRAAAGSEKAAFELIAAAATGAGLLRNWFTPGPQLAVFKCRFCG
jgi:hypothetical protein